MTEFLNIQSPKFLGGANVHNVVKIALAGYVAYQLSRRF